MCGGVGVRQSRPRAPRWPPARCGGPGAAAPCGSASRRRSARPRPDSGCQLSATYKDIPTPGKGDKKMKITGVKPWLVKAAASYWGEFLFVEVTTDEGVTGWGEITTTTKIANRAVCAILRQLSDLLVGEDPATSSASGTRSSAASPTWAAAAPPSNASAASTSRCGTSAARCSACRSTSCSAGRCATTSLLYTHPDQSKFTSKEGVVAEIRAIVDSGHTALKFDPFPHPRGRRRASSATAISTAA